MAEEVKSAAFAAGGYCQKLHRKPSPRAVMTEEVTSEAITEGGNRFRSDFAPSDAERGGILRDAQAAHCPFGHGREQQNAIGQSRKKVIGASWPCICHHHCCRCQRYRQQ
jgi:hypothetical protein